LTHDRISEINDIERLGTQLALGWPGSGQVQGPAPTYTTGQLWPRWSLCTILSCPPHCTVARW